MFHEVLVESVPRGLRGTGAGLFSLAIHVLVVATAVVLSARVLEEPPDPPSPVIYRVSMPPPLGSGGSDKLGAPVRKTQTSQPVPGRVFPPVAFSSAPVPPHPAMESAEATEGPGEGSGGSGEPDGVEGGTGTKPGDTAEGGGNAAIPITGMVVAPQLTLRVEPIYPDAARIPRIQGVVILEAIITTEGRVEDLRVLRSPSSLLSDAAIAAVSKWRYIPATLNGRSVKVFLTVTVDFKLH
jgi:protein TonB